MNYKMFDRAKQKEVLELNIENVATLNVGLPGEERFRINTWHNVLVSMQKRTMAWVAQRKGRLRLSRFLRW